MSRRDELQQTATDYVLEHGLIGLSLRPLAPASVPATGCSSTTSARRTTSSRPSWSRSPSGPTRSSGRCGPPGPCGRGWCGSGGHTWTGSWTAARRCTSRRPPRACSAPSRSAPAFGAPTPGWADVLAAYLVACGSPPARVARVVDLVDAGLAGLHLDLPAVDDPRDLDRAVDDLADAAQRLADGPGRRRGVTAGPTCLGFQTTRRTPSRSTHGCPSRTAAPCGAGTPTRRAPGACRRRHGRRRAGQARRVPRHAAGAPGAGDAYFPYAGNGGFDVRHYDLDLTYTPPAADPAPLVGHLDGIAKIRLTATEDLDRFNLDLRGLDVESVQVDGKRSREVAAPAAARSAACLLAGAGRRSPDLGADDPAHEGAQEGEARDRRRGVRRGHDAADGHRGRAVRLGDDAGRRHGRRRARGEHDLVPGRATTRRTRRRTSTRSPSPRARSPWPTGSRRASPRPRGGGRPGSGTPGTPRPATWRPPPSVTST